VSFAVRRSGGSALPARRNGGVVSTAAGASDNDNGVDGLIVQCMFQRVIAVANDCNGAEAADRVCDG
jgi:hypothetical protein